MCGPYDETTTIVPTPINWNLSNETLSILKTKRIFHRIIVDNMSFVTFNNRLKSFRNAKLIFKQTTESLADAGFYFISKYIMY